MQNAIIMIPVGVIVQYTLPNKNALFFEMSFLHNILKNRTLIGEL